MTRHSVFSEIETKDGQTFYKVKAIKTSMTAFNGRQYQKVWRGTGQYVIRVDTCHLIRHLAKWESYRQMIAEVE